MSEQVEIVQPPPPAPVPSTIAKTWKALVCIGVILATGASGMAYLARFAKAEAVAAAISDLRQRIDKVHEAQVVTDVRYEAIKVQLDKIDTKLDKLVTP